MKIKNILSTIVALIFPFVLLSEDSLPPGLKFTTDGKPLVSPVDAPFVLKINADGYALKQAKLKDGGRGVYFMFTGDSLPNLSLWVETPGHCENLTKCKDIVASELRSTKNVKSYQKGNYYIFEYVQNLGTMKMAHLRIQAYVSGYWIDIHTSKIDGKIRDLLKTIELLEFSENTGN